MRDVSNSRELYPKYVLSKSQFFGVAEIELLAKLFTLCYYQSATQQNITLKKTDTKNRQFRRIRSAFWASKVVWQQRDECSASHCRRTFYFTTLLESRLKG